jgi:hypothetical protein
MRALRPSRPKAPPRFRCPYIEVPDAVPAPVLGDRIPDLQDEIPGIVGAIRARIGREDVLLTHRPTSPARLDRRRRSSSTPIGHSHMLSKELRCF